MSPFRTAVTMSLLVFLFSPSLFARSSRKNDLSIREAIFHISTESSENSSYTPWNSGYVSSATGSGFYVVINGVNYIMTNAHVVANGTYITILNEALESPLVAEVAYQADEIDLALLKVSDTSISQKLFANLIPLDIATELPLEGSPITLWGYPRGGAQLNIKQGTISRFEFSWYSHSNHPFLTLQTDALIFGGNSGGPAVDAENMVIGIAFQATSDGASNELIPATIIQRFITDIKDSTYDGTASLGIKTQEITTKAMRNFYKLKDKTGVVIQAINSRESAAKFLKVGDVLLSIDGTRILDNGTLDNRSKTEYPYIISLHQLNDTLPLTILREGKEIEFHIPLKKPFRLIKDRKFNTAYDYYIFGGIVFQVLTEEYADQYFDDNYRIYWGAVHPASEYLKFTSTYTNDNRTEIVLINTVFNNQINIGYDTYKSKSIAKVNNIEITSLKSLIGAFNKPVNGFHIINLNSGQKLILDTTGIDTINQEILERVGIEHDRSESLREFR